MTGIIYILALAFLTQESGSLVLPYSSQSGQSPVASPPAVSDAKGSNTGWWEKENGEFVFVVQISPAALGDFAAGPNGHDLVSDVPPEIAGYIDKVVVRIGTGELPRQSPSPQKTAARNQRSQPYIATLGNNALNSGLVTIDQVRQSGSEAILPNQHSGTNVPFSGSGSNVLPSSNLGGIGGSGNTTPSSLTGSNSVLPNTNGLSTDVGPSTLPSGGSPGNAMTRNVFGSSVDPNRNAIGSEYGSSRGGNGAYVPAGDSRSQTDPRDGFSGIGANTPASGISASGAFTSASNNGNGAVTNSGLNPNLNSGVNPNLRGMNTTAPMIGPQYGTASQEYPSSVGTQRFPDPFDNRIVPAAMQENPISGGLASGPDLYTARNNFTTPPPIVGGSSVVGGGGGTTVSPQPVLLPTSVTSSNKFLPIVSILLLLGNIYQFFWMFHVRTRFKEMVISKRNAQLQAYAE